MAEGNSVYDEIKNERKKFWSMSKEQKLKYFRSYYLGPTIVVTLVILFALWFFLETVVFHKDVLMAGCTINVKITDESYTKLTDGMLEYLGGDPSKFIANLSRDNYVDYTEDDEQDQHMNGYMDQTMLFTQIAAGEYSYMILDEAAMENIYESGYIADLTNVLSETFIEENNLQLYYADSTEESDAPIGIYLADTNFKCEAYLCIAIFVEDEMAEKLVDYIIN